MTKKKILVVDDEEDICELFNSTLSDAGYNVTTVNSGKECILKMRKVRFDLVLLDMFMPEVSGREVLERIANDKKLNKTKVAFLTVAQLAENDKSELMFLGSVDYINKLNADKDLIKRVKKILGV